MGRCVARAFSEIVMVVQVFENILKNPEKMAYYNQHPILEAAFMAMYEYKKSGHKFSDLPWFSLSKLSSALRKNHE
jgi:hypothetical protein